MSCLEGKAGLLTFVFMPPAQFSSTVPFTLYAPPSALA